MIYVIYDMANVETIDFSQVGETSPSTIRKSLDDTQFVIKWRNGYIPTFITDSSVVPIETYDHRSILELMSTDKWSQPIEEIE